MYHSFEKPFQRYSKNLQFKVAGLVVCALFFFSCKMASSWCHWPWLSKCLPCLPGPSTLLERKEVSLHFAEVMAFDGIWREILLQLSPFDLAILHAVSMQLHATCQSNALSDSLVATLGLRACHILDAELLNFVWLGYLSGRLASGEDGWDTLLASARIGSGRIRWMLEVLQLKGMLLVGVADEALQTNSLLGSSKCPSWGWEISRKGVEPISGSGAPWSISLDPESQRLVLLLHFYRFGDLHRLELSLLRQGRLTTSDDSSDPHWEWLLLGHHDLPVGTLVQQLRPAVSVDVGAAVRVLCSELFPARDWLSGKKRWGSEGSVRISFPFFLIGG